MNLPNFLTLIRFILIPFCGYALYTDRFLLAGILFVAACLTDLLDGYVARKYDMITNFGKLADPAADKLLLLTVLFILAIKSIMGIGGLTLLKKKYVVSAHVYGKLATFFFNFSVAIIIFLKPNTVITNILLVISVVLMFVALIYYTKGYFKIKEKVVENEAENS